MSSAPLQSALISLQQNNYLTLSIIAAVGYDYVLTFSNEIEYIWSKPWTWVSTLFILVRYSGLCSIMTITLLGSIFLPGPAKMCEIVDIIALWTFVLFLGAADFVMILRVWAMYNRSRLILSALLAVFLLEIIFIVIVNAMYSNARNRLPVAAIQILDFSFCVVQPTSPIWRNIATILQTTHGAAMCILAIIQFVRQSLQMYRVTKQWQISRYTSLLVREGILYFFAVFLFSLLDALNGSGTIPAEGWQADLSIFLEYVPMYALSPRFILNIRKLYARDVQGRRGDGIDSGFGLSSSGRGAGGTEIVFADVEQSHELEDLEEIPMEVMTTQPE